MKFNSSEIAKQSEKARNFFRQLIEDSFLPNEREENGWKDTSDYRYVKLGGTVIGGAKDYLGSDGEVFFAIPYKWTHHKKTLNLESEWKTLCPIAVEAVQNQLTVVSDANIKDNQTKPQS